MSSNRKKAQIGEEILAAVIHAIGSTDTTTGTGTSTAAALPIPPLIQLIAAYAAPFVVTFRIIKLTATTKPRGFALGFTIACSIDDEWMLACTPNMNQFRKHSIVTGKNEVFCGSGADGCVMGNRHTAAFGSARTAVCDPLTPRGYYLADRYSIRYFDETKDEVTLVAGRFESGDSGGIGDAASVGMIFDLLITSDGKTLWCGCAYGHPLRRIDTATRQVTEEMGCYASICSMCWDRSTVKPDSAIYLVTPTSGLYRYDIDSGRLHEFTTLESYRITNVASTPAGYVVFSTATALYVFDPVTLDVDWVHNTRRSDRSLTFVVVDSSRTIVTAERDGTLIVYALPPQYFPLPKCCDRDL